jgi:putative Holliday junction resolvase
VIALGVDLGERRIGIAVSDRLGSMARPVTVIGHGTLKEDVARVGELAAHHQAELIVVGLPLNMDGSAGPAARRARRFANALRRELRIEVELWDERLTTVEAEETLAGRPVRLRSGLLRATVEGRRRGQAVDSVAAAIILQGYLDARREKSGSDPQSA